MEEKTLKSNIWKLYLIKGIRSFMLTIPIIVLFFQENGLSMKEIFILQALFSLTMIILDVPTGYFSDIFSRKASILIGGVFVSFGFAIYSQSYGFIGFLVSEIFLGIGMSFISGADVAMLYDTLAENLKAGEYKKFEGRGLSIGLISEAAASVIGGLLALISLRFPLYWDAVISALIIPIAFTLYEPKKHRAKSEENKLKAMLKLVKFSLHEHKELKWLIIYSSIASSSTLTMVWFIQPYLLKTGIPLGMFGIAWASLMLFSALFSWNAQKIEKFLGRKKSLLLLIFLPAVGYFLTSTFWFIWSGIFILFFYAARGINNPITLDYINGLISSDKRATIISIRNLVGRLIFSVIGPIAGYANDVFSLKIALFGSGITFLALGLLALIFMKKHKAL